MRGPLTPLPLLLLLVLLVLAGVAATARGAVVIYRCTDASGAMTIQNDVACPKGSRQDRRVMEVPAATPRPAPLPVRDPVPARPAPPAIADATVPAAILADSDRLPPPALFACRTYADQRFLTDEATPADRCAPLQTTGIGGNTAMGAGAACEMVTDQCQRVPEEALCARWNDHLREAESALRFGRFERRDVAQAEVDRVARVIADTTCGL